MSNFEDKQLACRDCGKEFVWTAGEQEFFAQKGFQNAPTRCQDCRRSNKARVQDRGGRREMFQITCSDCGKQGEVPFQPKDPSSPVYCAECFRNRSVARGGRPETGASDDNAPVEENNDEQIAA